MSLAGRARIVTGWYAWCRSIGTIHTSLCGLLEMNLQSEQISMRLQGGFVWEWYDHGIEKKDENGMITYWYGGDFGDMPNNSNFCMDGLLRPDRKPSTGLLHYKQVIAPVKASAVDLEKGLIRIKNLRYFKDLGDITLQYEIVHDYTIKALEQAKHVGEILRCDETIVHIDAKHSGVGSNSCGEEQTYANKTGINDYSMNLTFKTVENTTLI